MARREANMKKHKSPAKVNYFASPGLPSLMLVTHEQFLRKYCEIRDITLAEIKSPTRKQDVCIERQIAMYFINKNFGLNGILRKRGVHITMEQMGACFNRDHATVISSCNRISDYLDTNKNFVIELRSEEHTS